MNKRQFTVSLPVDPEDAKRMLSDPNAAYSKKVLAELERQNDANMLAILNNKPVPYPPPKWIFDDDICPECGQDIE